MRFMNVKLPVIFLKEGSKFIAYTPALDISTCGETFEESKKKFEELVDIFFEEVEKMGTLKDVLTECGWEKLRKPKDGWMPPRIISQMEETFKVPCRV